MFGSPEYLESHRRAYDFAKMEIVRWQNLVANKPQVSEFRDGLRNAEAALESCRIRDQALRQQALEAASRA